MLLVFPTLITTVAIINTLLKHYKMLFIKVPQKEDCLILHDYVDVFIKPLIYF